MQTVNTKEMVVVMVTVLQCKCGNEIRSSIEVTLERYQICPERLWIPFSLQRTFPCKPIIFINRVRKAIIDGVR